MSSSHAWRTVAFVIGVGLDACKMDPGAADVAFDDAPTFDIVSDSSLPDATLPDGATRDAPAVDAPVTDIFDVGARPTDLDVTLPDTWIPDAGACHTIGSPSVFGSETRVLTRDVWLEPSSEELKVFAPILRDGAESIWLHTARTDGTTVANGAVSDVAAGFHVRGGSFASFVELRLIAYSSDETGHDEIYVNASQDNAMFVAHTKHRISSSNEPSTSPQIVLIHGGYVMAWRSGVAGSFRLTTARLDASGALQGAPVDVSATGANVTSFRLVASDPPTVIAVAYRDARASAPGVLVQPLASDATAVGSPTSVVMGSDIADGIDAVTNAGDLTVVWTQPASAPTLWLRRIGIVAGGAGTSAPVQLSNAPGPAAQPGIELDGAGYVIGYRAGSAPNVLIAIARAGADLALLDWSIASGAATGGRVAVGPAAPGAYGLAWADDFASGTVVRMLAVQCP